LFPSDASIFDGTNSYAIKGKQGCGLYQDCMLFHALRMASRTHGDTRWADLAAQIAAAWTPLIDHPVWDAAGATNLGAPYYLLPEAPDLRAFIAYEADSPLYITQFAPFVADPQKRADMERLALSRQYGNLQKILPSELQGKPS